MSFSSAVLWDCVKWGLELPFVLLNVSVLLCIVVNVKRRQPGFRTDFFMLYSWQSTVDLALYTCVSSIVNFLLVSWNYSVGTNVFEVP